MSMKQSLPGLIERAADILDRDAGEENWGPYYASGLRELLANLTILRNEPHRHGEFFELYTDGRAETEQK